MRRTVSIPVSLDEQAMLATMSSCAEVFNKHVEWGLANKSYNKNKAHHALYKEMRSKHPELPSAMIQACRDNAMEALRSCKFRRHPSKRPTSGIRLDQRTFAIRGSLLVVSSVAGRQRTSISFPDWSRNITDHWKLKGANLVYSKVKRRFRINLCYEVDDPQPVTGTVIGIDRGLRHMAVTSDGRFFSSSKVRASQRRFLHVRRTLQAKGTKSAKRRLRFSAGKEMRFSRDVNHVVSKRLAGTEGVSTFVLETLDGIRQRRRGKKANKRIASWPFWQLESFLAYKAEALGKKVEHVDARYTSQRCSRCGCVNAKNRNKSRFLCVRCGMRTHADLNAAINIKDRFVLSGTPWETPEQAKVNKPYALPSGERKPTALAVGS